MATSIGKIQLDLGVNSSGFKQQLRGAVKSAKTSTNSMSAMFGKLGGVIAGVFAVKKIADFAKSCINLGSDLAEVQNVVDVTFGSMSNQVNDFAKNAMESYGLSEKVAKQYMGTFGAMSKSFGNTTAAAYDQAAALTGLAGDVASFYNLTTDEAYTKLKSVFTGETESLKELGVVMTQTALDEYALQKGMGKTTSAMSEQEKVALRLAFVQDRLATASGDFARTSDGWANQTRVLSLRFDALKASIGQGLINVLLPIVRVLNEIVARLQVAADAFKDFTEAIFGKAGSSSSAASAMSGASADLATNTADAAASAKSIKKSLAGFDQINLLSSGSDSSSDTPAGSGSSGGTIETPSIDTGASDVNSRAEKIKAFLDDVKTKLGELANITGLSGLWDDFLISVDNAKSGVLNLFESFKGAIENSKPAFEEFKTSISNTFLTVSQTVTGIFGDMFISLSGGFASFTEEYSAEIETAFTNVLGIITEHATLISDAAGDIWRSISAWWEEDGKRIFDEVVSAVKDVAGWILEIWNKWIVPVIENAQKVLRGLWDNHLKPLWDNVLGALTDVWDAIKAVWDFLKPVVSWIIDECAPIIVNAFNTISNVVGAAIGMIIDAVDGMVTSLRGVAMFISGVFSGDWKKAWEGIQLTFKGIWDAISGVFKGVGEIFSSVFEGMITHAESCWSAITTFFAPIGEWFGEKLESVKKTFASAWKSVKSKTMFLWESIKAVFSGIGEWFGEKLEVVKQKFLTAWEDIKTKAIELWLSITSTFSGIGEWFREKTSAVKEKFLTAWEGVKTGASGAWSGITSTFSSIGTWFGEKIDSVKEKFSGMWSKLTSGASEAWKKIKETFSSIGTWFGEKIETVKSKFSSGWSDIKTKAGELWKDIKSIFTGIGSWFGEKLDDVKGKFSGTWSKLTSGASEAWKGIKETFSNVPKWFGEKFGDAWKKVKEVFSSGGTVFSGIKEGIVSAFKTIVNKLIDGINTVVATPFNKINDMLSSIRNVSILGKKPFSWLGSISVPKIPKLATGGYVEANSPQLAIIGDNKREGEIVAPESKIAEAVAAGVAAAMRQVAEILNARNKGNQTTPVVIKIGEMDFWQGFVDFHNSTVKRTGESPLLI